MAFCDSLFLLSSIVWESEKDEVFFPFCGNRLYCNDSDSPFRRKFSYKRKYTGWYQNRSTTAIYGSYDGVEMALLVCLSNIEEEKYTLCSQNQPSNH